MLDKCRLMSAPAVRAIYIDARPNPEGGTVVERQEWQGLVRGRTDDGIALSLRAPLGQGTPTAASPFMGLLDDGEQWWVKAPFPGMTRALVTELVVGKVGAMIGAPVCQVEAVHIPPALLPHEVAPGKPLVAGIGSATRNLEGTITEIRGSLNRRFDDDNTVRHAGVYALVDWCFGSDHQWLQRIDEDWELHSHDHGWFLPPSGPDWTEASLTAEVYQAQVLPDDPSGLNSDELERLAGALTSLTREQLCATLLTIPAGMNVSDSELECLGWFLETRAPEVATRLRGLTN